MNDTYNRRIPGNINDAIPMLQIGPKKKENQRQNEQLVQYLYQYRRKLQWYCVMRIIDGYKFHHRTMIGTNWIGCCKSFTGI